ncbi:hypothetical protein AB0436_21505 [Streptomyces sp. NPDC051322]|uniref:hypothetical protein n=1 Tax=Streptomyces sp. NPDC051322 TaxID=3154645 RepID=UPI00344EB724
MRGTSLGAAALLSGAAILCGAATAMADPGQTDVAQDNPVTRLLGTVRGPMADTSAPCAAPYANHDILLGDRGGCHNVQINRAG